MKNTKVLDALPLFVDTVRYGSFSATARRRGLVASTVARQIDSIEAELQAPLFTRTTRSLTPTKAGELLYRWALRVLDDVADIHNEIASLEDEVRGTLEVSCLPTFGRKYVLPCLAKLYSDYPRLRIDLDLTEKLTVPTEERQDVTIRFGEQPDSQLIATRIASQRYVICAAPEYLDTYGHPHTVDELRQHRLIDKRHRASTLGWREIIGVGSKTEAAYILECDDFEAQRILALSGAGLAKLPDWVIGSDLKSGALVEVLVQDANLGNDSGIYMLRALPKPNAKLRAFTEALKEVIGDPPVWR